ncbi:alpha/beta fold hydrolase [Paenibacillus sp. 481]|uniref:alpha/beta fold hydrolase n=1 Tax=Paenibacillus sp. 481 TaxID=2835869 RepID=UPI001E65ABBF|nr:alpha/beta hydrolase [Paenibacillus sp. 481]UHA74760.1 alpha/beta fold hydrolase [Paenibacillus sp. 481]
MTHYSVNENVHVYAVDQGEGVPVILLHGYCGSSQYWSKVAPSLSAHYRVITPDLRGHGKSDAPNGAYTIEQMADDVLGLADKLGLDQFVLLGHSLGGYIALSVAERYSERLLGFGLIHSTAYPDTEEGKQNRLKAVETIQAQGIASFVDNLVPKLFAPDHAQSAAAQLAREIGYHTPPQGAVGAALAMRERLDRTSVLHTTSLPVLLVAGEQDQIVPAEKLFIVDGTHITQAAMKGVGHMGMFEDPDGLVDIVTPFISSLRS